MSKTMIGGTMIIERTIEFEQNPEGHSRQVKVINVNISPERAKYISTWRSPVMRYDDRT